MASTTTIRPEIAAASPVAASGIGLGALAFGLFSIMDALIKWLSATYPVPQLVVFNALFALVPITLLIARRGGLLELRTERLGLHLLRGALGMLGSFLAFYAYSRLPLADAYAIIFATPLLITALSVPILGEAVGWRRWSAVLVGFVGILVMLRPGVAPIAGGSLAALGAACASACAILLVRKLSVTETTTSIAFYSSLTVLVLVGALFGHTFVVPGLVDLALMAASGLIGGSALLILIAAYRRSPAALVAPFQYSQMLWAVVLGALFWGDLPAAAMLLGASIVAASGLFIVYRETALGRRPTASLHPSAGTQKA
jgi:drug/metabolite transporter (DMT)-like permease